MPNAYVVGSSALFFVPTLLSFFRQSIVVTIVLFNAALFSTLYHFSDETEYENLDIIWASITVLMALLLMAILARRFPPWNWRVFLPFSFGLAAFIVYFTQGQARATEGSDELDTDSNTYILWHSLWHVLIGLAGTFLVWTPVNLADANISYAQLYKDIHRNYVKNTMNVETFSE